MQNDEWTFLHSAFFLLPSRPPLPTSQAAPDFPLAFCGRLGHFPGGAAAGVRAVGMTC